MVMQMTVVDDRFIAYRVRVELSRQKRTQRWLARQLDEQPMWLNRRLVGEDLVPFTVTEIARVAQALGVDVLVFFPPASMEREAV
ncbi:hypothetical protein [Actinomadura sp. NPDC048394]|uniref:hypothetical protein n=1 Tax=Actinomadura sp. NPDC048394 TaxID=3158223 RepID=UPI0033CA3FF0